MSAAAAPPSLGPHPGSMPGGPGCHGIVSKDDVDDGTHAPFDVFSTVGTVLDQGFCICDEFLSPEEVGTIRTAMDSEVPITTMKAIGTETSKTLRAHNLLAKTRACDFVFLDKRLRAVVKGVVGPLVQVNVTTLFNTLPGEKSQFFHRDDGLWPMPRPHPSLLCNALFAIDDFDEKNGATTIVPYSHKMFDQQPPVPSRKNGTDGSHPDQIQLSMKSGSVVFWESGLWCVVWRNDHFLMRNDEGQ